MIPYSFTITSHIFITFSLALTLFIGINIISIKKHKLHFLGFFLPNGIHIALAPLLVPIEIASYISRVFSLSIRLFAKMMSGHTLLKIIAGFA
jgi:F-type H+-transporting ATPase subunit a